MQQKQTISEQYRRQQQELHESPHYGVASIGYARIVKHLVEAFQAGSIADYGAGKCRLKHTLDELGVTGVEYLPYDPAFPEYGPPRPADLVCCIDVLEHIEPEFLDNVLEELATVVRKHGMFTIHTGPALKQLADGRNAHLIQRPRSWWLPMLSKHFEVIHMQGSTGGFWVVVVPRESLPEISAPESA